MWVHFFPTVSLWIDKMDKKNTPLVLSRVKAWLAGWGYSGELCFWLRLPLQNYSQSSLLACCGFALQIHQGKGKMEILFGESVSVTSALHFWWMLHRWELLHCTNKVVYCCILTKWFHQGDESDTNLGETLKLFELCITAPCGHGSLKAYERPPLWPYFGLSSLDYSRKW